MKALIFAALTLAACKTTEGRYGVSSEAVEDPAQGLQWERTPPDAAMSFAEAAAHCKALGEGWRLPERDELKALVDDRRPSPVIDPRFEGTKPTWYWSSTPMENASRFVWGVSFEYGGLHYLYRQHEFAVRCVHPGEKGAIRVPPLEGATPAVNATVEAVTATPDYVVLAVRPKGAAMPDYKVGQTVLIGVPEGLARASATAERYPAIGGGLLRRRYTIISRPAPDRPLEIAVRMRPDGQTSPRLHSLKPGASIYMSPEIRGPDLLKLIGDKQAVLIGTGIGIAHFVGIARGECPAKKTVLIHGAKFEEELWFRAELEAFGKRCPSFLYAPTLLEPGQDWTGIKGGVEAALEWIEVREHIGGKPGPADTHISMCATLGLMDKLIGQFAGVGYQGGDSLDWCEAD